jgi:hypothetical protein
MSTSLVTSDPKLLNSPVFPVVAVPEHPLAFSSQSEMALSDPIEDIRVRAQTMSSVLREIIEQRPSRHWGINE